VVLNYVVKFVMFYRPNKSPAVISLANNFVNNIRVKKDGFKNLNTVLTFR